MFTRPGRYLLVLIAITLQACIRAQVNLPTDQSVQTPDSQNIDAQLTPTKRPATSTPTATEAPPTPTDIPNVTITAITGNINIRRGPDIAYNFLSVLRKGQNAKAIARDVLAKWVLINIPGSDKTGWVFTQTGYSQIDGDLDFLPEITPTEWPVPAYLRNCTHHLMYILPGMIYLPSSYAKPDNEIWINPGSYSVFDLDVPEESMVLEFSISEGGTVEIREDALGEKRKCP